MRTSSSWKIYPKTTASIVALIVLVFFVLQAQRELAKSLTLAFFGDAETAQQQPTKGDKLKIALLSGFVARDHTKARISNGLMDHMINKACYADLWGYDYIFNETWGFDQDVGDRYWLEYGTWHRVPHIQAALDHGYDWVIYADTDWIVQVCVCGRCSDDGKWNQHQLNLRHSPFFLFTGHVSASRKLYQGMGATR